MDTIKNIIEEALESSELTLKDVYQTEDGYMYTVFDPDDDKLVNIIISKSEEED